MAENEPIAELNEGTNELRSGLDVVVEGIAARVTDQETLERLAAIWKAKLDWDFVVQPDALSVLVLTHVLVP